MRTRTKSSRRVWLTGLAVGIGGCVTSLPPADNDILPSPDELFSRILAVARSGAVRDPRTSERLLGIRWDSAGRASQAPRWLAQPTRGSYPAELRALSSSIPRLREFEWRVFLQLNLNVEAICISAGQVIENLVIGVSGVA